MNNFFKKVITGILLLLPLLIAAQPLSDSKADRYLSERGEVYFRFARQGIDPEYLTRIISLDNIKNDTVYAYANRKEFDHFLKLGISFETLTPPSLVNLSSFLKKSGSLKDWDVYPSYTEYVTLMNDFATNYPALCQIHEIGITVEGRKLLAVKLSDNVAQKEAEPEFFFTSSMHGNEVTGYMLTLRLIDYLLSNYETDENVRQLLDTIEIWINPLANPDGTYFGSNSSVTGATRFNANGVDLNRNFRDPGQGAHPDGNPWQPETEAMMDFMTGHHFVLSANYHGGAEVMNYPWDTWSRSHPDEDWFIHISYQYADTVKKYAGSTYFSDVVPDGVTNGYDWYPVFGGRQDFTTYFAHGREITIEVSSNMMPPANTMPDYWEYNRQAMLQYIRQCTYGIHGIVRDSVTGMPITARIEILSHDADSSHIYAEAVNGDFHRLLNPGSYSLKVSYPGYKQKILESITLPDFTSSLWTEVELAPGRDIPSLLYETEQDRFTSFLDAENKLWINIPDEGSLDVVLYSAKGQMVYKTKNVNHTGGFMIVDLDENLTPGMYFGRVIRNGKYLGEIRFSCK